MFDVHSHIIPAIDDGSASMEESLAMLKIAYDEGIRTMIATPHNMPGKGCPSKAKVLKELEDLRETAESEGIKINLLPGTEYFYREEVLELFEENEIIPLADSRCVLVEFDTGVGRTYVKNAIREILAQDFIPVVAHVERYERLMMKKQETVKELRDMGALIQVNCGSIMGNLGFKTKWNTRAMLDKGWVDLLGTDAHSSRHRAPRMQECAKYLKKKYDPKYCKRLLMAEALNEYPAYDNDSEA